MFPLFWKMKDKAVHYGLYYRTDGSFKEYEGWSHEKNIVRRMGAVF